MKDVQTIVVGNITFYNESVVLELQARMGEAARLLTGFQPTAKESIDKPLGYINPAARKLSHADVRRIRANVEGWSGVQWARHFKVAGKTMNLIISGKTYRDVV